MAFVLAGLGLGNLADLYFKSLLLTFILLKASEVGIHSYCCTCFVVSEITFLYGNVIGFSWSWFTSRPLPLSMKTFARKYRIA